MKLSFVVMPFVACAGFWSSRSSGHEFLATSPKVAAIEAETFLPTVAGKSAALPAVAEGAGSRTEASHSTVWSNERSVSTGAKEAKAWQSSGDHDVSWWGDADDDEDAHNIMVGMGWNPYNKKLDDDDVEDDEGKGVMVENMAGCVTYASRWLHMPVTKDTAIAEAVRLCATESEMRDTSSICSHYRELLSGAFKEEPSARRYDMRAFCNIAEAYVSRQKNVGEDADSQIAAFKYIVHGQLPSATPTSLGDVHGRVQQEDPTYVGWSPQKNAGEDADSQIAHGKLPSARPSLGDVHGRVQQEDPTYVGWSPPPEFASKTWGHKTMYLVDVAVGTYGQSFRMLVDTGSSMLVLPAATCHDVGCSAHRRFDVSNSTSSNRTAAVSYVLGSMSGHIFSDAVCARRPATRLREVGLLQRQVATSRMRLRRRKVSLPEGDSTDAPSKAVSMCTQMSFMVADHESADFADAPFDGILGLGLQGPTRDSGDGFSFLRQLKASGHLPGAVFTLRLGNQGTSELVLGYADESNLIGGLLWVPLSPLADGRWQISLSDLTLNGAPQNMGAMEVIVDSGTSLLAPDDNLAELLGARLTPPDCASVDALPWLGLQLPSGSELTLLPSDYIDRIDGKCSLAVMSFKRSASSKLGTAGFSTAPRLILGDSFLRRFTTVFDLEGRRLGFGIATDSDLAKDVAARLFPDSLAG